MVVGISSFEQLLGKEMSHLQVDVTRFESCAMNGSRIWHCFDTFIRMKCLGTRDDKVFATGNSKANMKGRFCTMEALEGAKRGELEVSMDTRRADRLGKSLLV